MVKRIVRPSYLIVVEDSSIECLIKHIKSFVNPSSTFVIKRAYGGSICDVLQYTLNHAQAADYEFCCSIYDADRFDLGQENLKQLQSLREKLSDFSHTEIKLEPLCVEGLLLKIAKKRVPNNSESCKTAFGVNIAKDRDYEIDQKLLSRKFPEAMLKEARKLDLCLGAVFALFEIDSINIIREDRLAYRASLIIEEI